MSTPSPSLLSITLTTAAVAIAATAFPFSSAAQTDVPSDSLSARLDEVVVKAPPSLRKLTRTASNTELISASELQRAACCNLGESFTTNPSVDVSYSDAATGSRQIRLLGLAGTYVQTLTENIPNFRGAAAPYGLGYVAGPWMQSIQVSKGASSVKNGYESITGQINIEMRKPQLDPSLSVNAYADHKGKVEANFGGNLHFGERWSGGLLLHGENAFKTHDENGDGFSDAPRVRQLAAMNRWAYLGTDYVAQAAVKFIAENRRAGQIADSHSHRPDAAAPLQPYIIDIDTRRVEAFVKNAYIFDHHNDGNVALILSANHHNQNSSYGHRLFDIRQTELLASLMFERKWSEIHALSTGVSLNHDRYDTRYRLATDQAAIQSDRRDNETVGGIYAQYTLNLESRLIAMAGVRYDYNSLYGSLLTPRVHLRGFAGPVTLHASAGIGYHSPHPLADYSYLLASSRRIELPAAGSLAIEKGTNFGGGASWDFHIASCLMQLSAEFYHTSFSRQLTVDLSSDPHAAIFNPRGRSRSNTLQIELTARPTDDLSLTAAYRMTRVRVDYGQGFVTKPLTPASKALLTAGYNPMMGLWQFDVTLTLNGSGRMPDPYTLADGALSWRRTFRPYLMLNAQATRNFRHWAVYIGGENLTGYRQKNPVIGAGDPWGSDFDATMVYGPIHGAVVYVGFRYNITKYL